MVVQIRVDPPGPRRIGAHVVAEPRRSQPSGVRAAAWAPVQSPSCDPHRPPPSPPDRTSPEQAVRPAEVAASARPPDPFATEAVADRV